MRPLNRKGLMGAAAATAIAIASLTLDQFGVRGMRAPAPANAAEARVIEIKAKKFEFTPDEVTLKKGEPVILRLTTEDRTHGFLLKPMNVDTDIPPGKTTDIAVSPQVAGDYTVVCDHYCGYGHGNMKMKVTVTD